MIACVDVDYPEQGGARAACLVIPEWTAAQPAAEYLCRIDEVAAYEPGSFYKRELPCVLAVLERVREVIELIVIDGYVTLDAGGRAGMGAHLYAALDQRVPVIGVAKHPFRGYHGAIELLRGSSARPLYVTAIGIDAEAAANDIRRMHGRFRLPTVLKRVDRLCRDGV